MEIAEERKAQFDQKKEVFDIVKTERKPSNNSRDDDIDISTLLSMASESLENKNKPKRTNPAYWAEEQDVLLIKSVHKNGTKSWAKIAAEVPGKNRESGAKRWKRLTKGSDKLSKFEKDRIILKHADQHGLNFGMLVDRLKMEEQQISDRFNEIIEGLSKITFSEEEKIAVLKKYLSGYGDLFKAIFELKIKEDRGMYYFAFMRMVHAGLKELYPDKFTFADVLRMRKNALGPYVWEVYRNTFAVPNTPLSAYLYQLIQNKEVKLSCDSSLSEDVESLSITIEPLSSDQYEKLHTLYTEVSEWDDG